MRILISGICGFTGSAIARFLREEITDAEIIGFDNLSRAGSEINRAGLKRLGIEVRYGDVRATEDIDSLPAADWVIDAAANPSVLAGVDGRSSSRQLIEHNLVGTINLLEYCKRVSAGFVLLSTSRVYSINPLASLPLDARNGGFVPRLGTLPKGLTAEGISEGFPTAAPVSLYGSTKIASEALALEYGNAFGLRVFVNRCGVLAGAGQFGRPDQGIFSYWIHSYARRRPLKFVGFDGLGHQVRDCLHPKDLARLIRVQIHFSGKDPVERIVNVSGGADSALSLLQLSRWCSERFGAHSIGSDPEPRPFDLPWIVLDSAKAAALWGWRPQIPASAILNEIADHAEANPDWLDLSSA